MRIIIVIIGGMLLMTSCNQQIINRDSTVCKIDLKKQFHLLFTIISQELK